MTRVESYISDKLSTAAKPKLMTVIYEDVYENLEQYAEEFLTFLELRPRKLTTAQKKVHAGRVDDVSRASSSGRLMMRA
jgi:hypothetical protein